MSATKYWPSLLLLTSFTPGVQAADTVHLCQDEIEETPWRTLDNNGLNLTMLRMVEKRVGQKFLIENLSWKRCLLMVQEGAMDGAIASSYREERRQMGAFPAMPDGQMPDRHRRMSGETYFFYTLKNSSFAWDGNTIAGAQLPVAVQMGYSAVARLQEKGVRVDDRERRPENLLRKVLAGLDSAAVLAQGEGERLLRDPRFAGKLVKQPIALYQTDGYLLLSHSFVARNPQHAQNIWNGIAAVRTSVAYRKKLLEQGQPVTD